MNNDDWEPGTCYLRHFDKEGRAHVQEHSCWHMSKFLAAAQKAAVEAGGRVEQITQAEFQASKKQ